MVDKISKKKQFSTLIEDEWHLIGLFSFKKFVERTHISPAVMLVNDSMMDRWTYRRWISNPDVSTCLEMVTPKEKYKDKPENYYSFLVN